MHTFHILHFDDDARVVLRRLLGGALFLCLISLADMASRMHTVPVGARVLIDPIAFWLFWAMLSVPALFLIRGIDRRATLIGRATRHALTAAALMLLHSAALYLVQRGAHLMNVDWPVWWGALAIARWRLTSNLLVYGAIVGAIRISDTERVARDRQGVAARLAEQLSAAQLEALRLQLNPHFLFNSLNTVAMLVRRGAAADAVHAITQLADLLRRLLRSDGARFVSLGEELSLLRAYLELEQLRFGDRLRVVHEIDDAALDASVPPFLLQPVVENAIRHGIARVVAGGTLRITARRVGARLHIEIADDGPGMEPNRIGPPGIGLANTVERLTALYGSAFDLDIRSMPGATVALISFPATPLVSTLRSAS